MCGSEKGKRQVHFSSVVCIPSCSANVQSYKCHFHYSWLYHGRIRGNLHMERGLSALMSGAIYGVYIPV